MIVHIVTDKKVILGLEHSFVCCYHFFLFDSVSSNDKKQSKTTCHMIKIRKAENSIEK